MKTIKALLVISLAFGINGAQAANCRVFNWAPGKTLTVSSAIRLGTRIELPVDQGVPPVPSNRELWDVEGAARTILIKPNSEQPEGKQTMIRAFTTDGITYDITAVSVPPANNEACVIVKTDGTFFNASSRAALQGISNSQSAGSAALYQQTAGLQQQLMRERQEAADNTKKAVMEALRKFRHHIYTRYEWDQGKGFAATNMISDVYDDGRFTYIRLNTPNRGLPSIESVIGEKNAIVPAKYDDAYGMYTINGIYPSFTLKVDDALINISRADAKTNGK